MPTNAAHPLSQPRDAELRLDERVETLDLKAGAERVEGARDQAEVDAADDPGGELPVRAVVHVDLAVVSIGVSRATAGRAHRWSFIAAKSMARPSSYVQCTSSG